jgi:cysteinyl-tRNA synthetase
MSNKYGNILDLIGGTPLVPIKKLNSGTGVEILSKLEFFNPGGSVKDRPALSMIEDAEKKGELTKEKIILEATSGNTGIGLALVAAVKGYRVLLVMAESVSEERKKILRALGAELEFTPAHLSTDGAIEFVYNLVRKEPAKYWLADQFNSEANWLAHYDHTAPEILAQTDGELDMVIATMGTTGTLMGISKWFKENKPNVQIIGVEPYMGHKIQGLKNMKESYCPGIFDRSLPDRVIHIDDEEAYQTARLLAQKEGILVGMSSGAAMAAALRLAKTMAGGRIVVILPDGGERYLSTALFTDKKKSGLILYNTLSRRKEEFVPLRENRVTMYTCGPTLNGMIDIGQWRRYVFADLIRRYLEFRGFEVNHIMNVTDLDDRTISDAERAGQSLAEFTEQYYRAFLAELGTLNIKRAANYPKASQHVDDIIQLTQKLLEKGFAYEKFRSVYFDISRFKDYGKLSNIDLEKMQLGKTVDLEQYEKENPRDFTLLKRSTLNELKKGIFYQTRWGNVRPSWHMECPAMAMRYLGETYDLHTSSIDLIFPHHENAIAISQAATGKPPANYWIHNELVMLNGRKPIRGAETAGYTLKDILAKGYTGREIRYWLISRHYRKPISFSFSKLDVAKRTIGHLDIFVRKFRAAPAGDAHSNIDQLVYDLTHRFTSALDDDFNVSKALAALFEFARHTHRTMDAHGLSAEDKGKIEDVLRRINSVLGVLDLEDAKMDQEIEALVKKRESARSRKDWRSADSIREELSARGIELIDTKTGTVWRKNWD